MTCIFTVSFNLLHKLKKRATIIRDNILRSRFYTMSIGKFELLMLSGFFDFKSMLD